MTYTDAGFLIGVCHLAKVEVGVPRALQQTEALSEPS